LALALALTSQADAQTKKRKGVNGVQITSIRPESEAFRKGIRQGDWIIQVDGNDIEKQGDFEKALRDAGQTVSLTVRRIPRNGQREDFEVEEVALRKGSIPGIRYNYGRAPDSQTR
jgi:S1-C subfamily serine protease